MNRKLKNYNEIKYDLPDTSKGLPTKWAMLLVMGSACLSWLLIYGAVAGAIWLGSILLHGGK